MKPRRTSRKPVQVGQWTPLARRAQGTERSLRANATTRKGRLSYKHVQATEYKGKDSVFQGRIAVDRGGGIVEFPDVDQFDRIARQEKVPKDQVEKAFGHMRKGAKRKPARRTSRRTSRSPRKRRTSRKGAKKKKGRRASRPVRKNAPRRKQVRRDSVFVPATRDGQPQQLKAITALVPLQQVGVFGADRGILTTSGSQTVLLPYEQAFTILEPWLTKKEFNRAFGHLRTGRVLGETERRRPIPTVYGPRSMRLGHRTPPGEGPAEPGIVKGQLVLYHKPTGSIVWQAYDDEVNYPDKPLWVWFGAHKKHFDFPKAMSGAKAGRGERAAMIGAVDRGIPPMAMLQAFDHLLTPEQRREAYRVFAQM